MTDAKRLTISIFSFPVGQIKTRRKNRRPPPVGLRFLRREKKKLPTDYKIQIPQSDFISHRC